MASSSNDSNFSKKETSLLTLSRKAVMGKKDNDDDGTLVLMQLPSSFSAKDLKDAHMIASPSQQVCLVDEAKGRSYAMSRVETSNAYILVPPAATDERPRKKLKSDQTLVPVQAQLLKEGVSGASFIELKSKTFDLVDLNTELEDHVLDPYDTSKKWKGRTLESLAVDLQCSKKEVQDGLERIHALGLTSDGTVTYGLLSEEALQEAKLAIVSALTECDDFQDYGCSGISKIKCVDEVMKRTTEQFMHMREIIQHTLRALQVDSNKAENKEKTIQLDTKRIAVCVAHRVFCGKTEAWKEIELLDQWQREMPGVGDSYKVSLDMLSGVALFSEGKYKYFPEDKLPTDIEKRFEVLFEEKEKWTLDELKPYLKRLMTSEMSETDLLLRHARSVQEEVDGVSTKLFVKR